MKNKVLTIISFALVAAISFTLGALIVNSVNNSSKDPYVKSNKSYSYFNEQTKNNPIDKAYIKSHENDKEYTLAVSEYCADWMNEFDSTVNLVYEFFDETQAKELEAEMQSFKKSTISAYNVVNRGLFDENKKPYGAKAFFIEKKKIGDQFKEKTLWLKYLYFMKETGLKKENFKEDLLSLKWHYEEKTSEQ